METRTHENEVLFDAGVGDIIAESAVPPKFRGRILGHKVRIPRFREPQRAILMDTPEWHQWMREKEMRLANREALANGEPEPYPDAPDVFVDHIFERVEDGWKRVA